MSKEFIGVRVDPETQETINLLSEKTGKNPSEIIRQSLPTFPVASLFLQVRNFLPDLDWQGVVTQGTRQLLLGFYEQQKKAHYQRLGVEWEKSSADNIEAAAKKCLEELKQANINRQQYSRACDDIIYLGYLHDAWRQAEAGEPCYTISKVKPSTKEDAAEVVYIVVCKDGKPV